MTATTERPAPAIPGKVFITGANGYIGRALSARLRDPGAEVGGVDLVAEATNRVVAGSTTDPSPWSDALTGVDTLIHTAAIVSNAAPPEQRIRQMCEEFVALWISEAGTHYASEAPREEFEANVETFRSVAWQSAAHVTAVQMQRAIARTDEIRARMENRGRRAKDR